MAAALSFMSTVANNAPLSSLISTLDALFMNSTDASVVVRILLLPDVENVHPAQVARRAIARRALALDAGDGVTA